MPERGPELSLKDQQYIHDTMMDAVFPFVDPETGAWDILGSEPSLVETRNRLIEEGFCDDHIRFLTLNAVLHLTDFRKQLETAGPAGLFPSQQALIRQTYTATTDAFKQHYNPINPKNSNEESLNEELEDVIAHHNRLSSNALTVAIAKAHIDFTNEVKREFEERQGQDPQLGEFYD